MKYEWRKKDKTLYLPKNEPTIIDVPTIRYLTVTGEGNPNSEGFAECVGALYGISYGIRMMPKSGVTPEGYFEYTVFPLEGIWGFTEEGIAKYKEGSSIVEMKDYFTYKVMIRQPDFVTDALVEQVRSVAYEKKKNERILDVQFETINEGRAVQMMHLGPYDDEPASFARMEAFAKDQGLKRIGKNHKEIYLSDPSRVEPEKLKTTLRFWVSS